MNEQGLGMNEENAMVKTSQDKDANQWSMFLHFSMLAGFIVPFAGLIVPIVLWQMKKEEYPIVDVHGKVVVNWLISSFLYGVVCFILSFIVIGLFLFPVLIVICVIFPIIGGIKANDGVVWEYPMSLKLIK